MSKARSPRDVCSTTIGTKGLIGAPVYRSPSAAFFPLGVRSPELPAGALIGFGGALVFGRPQLAALAALLVALAACGGLGGLCLGGGISLRLGLDLDRGRVLDHQVDRGPGAQVGADEAVAAVLAQALEQLLGG